MMTELEDRLVTLLTTKVGVTEGDVHPEVTFDELEIDSLVLIEFSLILKKELGVHLQDGELKPYFTVQQVAELLNSKGVSV